jgi:hypothetical protein
MEKYIGMRITYSEYYSENVTILKGKAELISFDTDGKKHYFSQQTIDIQDVNHWKLNIKEISKEDLQKKLDSL